MDHHSSSKSFLDSDSGDKYKIYVAIGVADGNVHRSEEKFPEIHPQTRQDRVEEGQTRTRKRIWIFYIMEVEDNGSKEDKDKGSTVNSGDDNPDSNIPVHGAQNSETGDLPNDQDSVLQNNEVFQKFFSSFVEANAPHIDLKLEITSQLLDRINAVRHVEDEPANANDSSTTSSTPKENLKAAHLEAKELIIGNWHRKANPNVPKDLVVKIYFQHKKLIWEIMHAKLKNKVEIKWEDIVTLHTYQLKDKSEVLKVEVRKLPKFSRETNLNPRCHTKWEENKDDFTGGEAMKSRFYTMICAPRVLFSNVSKLLQSDDHLNQLSNGVFPSRNTTHSNTIHSKDSMPDEVPSQNGHQTNFSSEFHLPREPCSRFNRSMLQSATIPSYPAGVCIYSPVSEDSRTIFVDGGRHNIPDSAQLRNGNGNIIADGMENFAGFFHDMNWFGGNMNSFGSNGPVTNSSSFLDKPCTEGPSLSVSDYESHGSSSGGSYVIPQNSYSNYGEDFHPSQFLNSSMLGLNNQQFCIPSNPSNPQNNFLSYPQLPNSNPGKVNLWISSYPQYHIPSSSMIDPAYAVPYSSITSYPSLPLPDLGMSDPQHHIPSSSMIDPAYVVPYSSITSYPSLPLSDSGMGDPSSAVVHPSFSSPLPDADMKDPTSANANSLGNLNT